MNQSTSARLFKKLNYTFTDLKLVKVALSHRSVGDINNERLEFLGDSALNFIMTDYLYHTFAKAKEGELSRLRAHLVCEETLAEVSRSLDLGEYLQLGIGELKSGGFRRQSILADTLEAIIGAVFLESGIEKCRILILEWFKVQLDALTLQSIHKDPKTMLQEYLQSRKKSLPAYEIISITGEAHEQVFNIVCKIEGYDFVAEGIGSSKRRAEQEAAKNFLEWLKHE